jgi:hypothetical protein
VVTERERMTVHVPRTAPAEHEAARPREVVASNDHDEGEAERYDENGGETDLSPDVIRQGRDVQP